MRVLLIIVATALSGCVIAHDWMSRGASGTVVDASSGKPLAGVRIFRVLGYTDEDSKLVATTDSAGRFSVTALDHWYVTVPLGDAVGASKLAFRLAGYSEAILDTSTGIPAPKIPPLTSIVVKLHRKA
jgi:5-hydroxyisourate hydrolase-like protein (transthyretin family)